MAKLDLENFNELRFSDSKYILTSPRSLQSCSNLGIKPVELLSKDFSNFRNDLQYQDLSIRTITEMFNECEKERISKFVDEILLIVATAVCVHFCHCMFY